MFRLRNMAGWPRRGTHPGTYSVTNNTILHFLRTIGVSVAGHSQFGESLLSRWGSGYEKEFFWQYLVSWLVCLFAVRQSP